MTYDPLVDLYLIGFLQAEGEQIPWRI